MRPAIYNINPTEISYNVDTAMSYGEMPNEALIQKFEETPYLEDCEDVYENYARDTLKDQSPGPASLASDAVRKNYNSKGYLNLLHKGGRGEYNAPAHPEAFLELTEREPRGIATDPDFRKLKEQEEARMRFIRFSPDADHSISQGNWSESERFYKSRILTQKAIQPRLRVFTTSKDGRREGMRRDMYPHKSFVNKVQEDLTRFRPQDYTFTDYITDYALNPQRRSVFTSNMLTDRKLYNMFTTDHEFQVAKYGQDARKRKLTQSMKSRIGDVQTEDNVPTTCEDKSKAYKAIGLLMGAVVAQKHKADADQQYGIKEEGHGLDTQTRKMQALQKDLNQIMHAVKNDVDFKHSDNTQTRKNDTPQRQEHLARMVHYNHAKPAHHLFNVELMYKAVQPGADTTKLKHQIVSDDNSIKYEDLTIMGKRADKEIISGVKDTIMEVDGQSLTTQSYKTLTKKIKGAEYSSGEENKFLQKSEDTPDTRKFSNARYRVTDRDDVDPDTDKQFHENKYGERLMGSLGNDKYGAWRNATTSHVESGISDLN